MSAITSSGRLQPDPGQGGDAGAGLPYRALVAEIGAGAYLDDTRD